MKPIILSSILIPIALLGQLPPMQTAPTYTLDMSAFSPAEIEAWEYNPEACMAAALVAIEQCQTAYDQGQPMPDIRPQIRVLVESAPREHAASLIRARLQSVGSTVENDAAVWEAVEYLR